MENSFRILALDGGGLKGLFSAAVLAEFERLMDVNIASDFDLIAGTSTGGLIALALGAGFSPADIVEFYGRLGEEVFGRPRRLGCIFRPKHNAESLRGALREIFGDMRLRESECCLLIPSYSLTGLDVHVFKTPHASRFVRDGDVPMVDVALATSAAPLFLRPARLGNEYLIDGGIWANNPALTAIAEAHSTFGVDLADVHLLSLGTTTEVTTAPKRLRNGGFVQWARPSTLDIFLRAQATSSFHTAEHLLRRDAGRIVRIDPPVAKGLFDLDRVNEGDIRALAEHFAPHYCDTVRPFLGHPAPKHAFYKEGVPQP
jgi:patatin-like phospholipase/acyl hydrolase